MWRHIVMSIRRRDVILFEWLETAATQGCFILLGLLLKHCNNESNRFSFLHLIVYIVLPIASSSSLLLFLLFLSWNSSWDFRSVAAFRVPTASFAQTVQVLKCKESLLNYSRSSTEDNRVFHRPRIDKIATSYVSLTKIVLHFLKFLLVTPLHSLQLQL